MKKLLMFLFAIAFTSVTWGQVTVTNPSNVGPTALNGTYATLAAAITDLNTKTSITGPVTISLDAANPQTSPSGGYAITAILTGASSINKVTISGNNNIITAPSPAGTAGNLNDAFFKFIGADFMTLEGFVMNENAANTITTAASNTMMEWGVAILYATITNGAQNITIQNNSITLNRTYQNTFGIYSNSTHSATTVTASATATTTTGGNHNLTITGNTISNVNMGIVVIGPTAIADANNSITIGGSALNANTITNFGTTGTISSYANVSGTVNGILVRNTNNFNISYNNITSSNGGVTAGTLNGIQIAAANTAPAGVTFTNNINYNSISLKSAVAAGAINGINYPSGSASTTSTININNNDFNNFGHTIASSGTITFISNVSTHLNQSISYNTFTNIIVNTTGSVTFITNSNTLPALGGTKNINNNSIVTAFSKTGAGGTITLYTDNASSLAGTTVNNNSNNFSNITVTGATTIAGWSNTDGGAPTKKVENNTFNNWIGGTSAITVLNIGYATAGVNSIITGNTITNITGQSSITGLVVGSTSAFNVYSNTINNLSSTGAGGAVIGMSITSGSNNVYNHVIHTLSSTGASSITGISVSGATLNNIYKNKIYNLAGSNASSTVNGLTISGGTTVNAYNNFISDLRATIANAANPVNGINITGGTTSNIYYNTVYLNTSSSGALFGSSAIYASVTPTVNLRNNIFVNKSTPNGATGYTSAYRRSSTTLTTYASTSNNNCFYAGTPGSNNVIYFDGTLARNFADFKTLVASRDAASFSEDITFVNASTTPFDLTLKTGSPTQCESGALPISGITDDYFGTGRNISTPDVGAYEGNLTPLDLSAPSISYTPLLSTASTLNRTLTASISDPSGVSAVMLYWRINSNPYNGVSGNNTIGNTWEFNFGSGVNPTDVISYYIVAQDNAPANNVGAFPNAGVTNYNSGLQPSCSPDPTNASSYTIIGSLCGTYAVGTGKDYATLTAAITDLNNKEVTCPVVFELYDATYPAETFPIVINANGGSSVVNTITIKPASGVNPTLSGTVSSGALIKLNGADYVIIDGSNNGTTTKDLSIINNGTSSATIQLISLGSNLGSTYNTIKNCIIKSGAITSGNYGIVIGGSAIATNGADNDNNTIQNNTISKAYVGIWAQGSATANPGLMDNLQVIGNSVGSANVADYIAHDGIMLANATGCSITQNAIYNLIIASSTPAGITIGTGVVSSTLTRNNINNVTATGTSGYGGRAIYVNTSNASSNLIIANNVIYSIGGDGYTGFSNSSPVGIYIDGNTGGLNIYFNSVKMSGTLTYAGTTLTAAILFNTSTITGIDLKNNIFTNSMNNTASGSTAKNYAIYSSALNTAFTTINYNNYFVSGTQGVLGFIGSDLTDLAGIQTGFGQNINSVNADPVFSSATDLTPTVAALNGTGVNIPSVTVDYNNVVRSNPPDIGAIEFAPPSCISPTALIASLVTATTATISWTAAVPAPSSGYEYEIRTSGAAGSGATGLVSSGTTAAGVVTKDISSLTANTSYSFYVRSNCGSTNSNWTNAGSFITLCNAISSYPLVENFDGTWVGSPAAPACWTVVNADADAYTWRRGNSYITPTPSTPYAAEGMGSNNDWLISPAMVINGPIVLKWKDKVESASYRNTYSVKVSITDNNTSSFATTVQTYDCINTSWIEHSIDLSSYVGSTIYIAFHQTYSAATNYGFGIDDVTFLQTTFPTVTTTTATALTGNSATSGGNVTNDGNGTISARGVCWSVNPNPTITNDKTTDGTGIGVFVSNITGLNANTLYYYRAYATNAIGTAYGDELSITTLGTYAPSVTTNPISSLTNTTVTLSGEITANGGDATISESGIVYSTSANPTIITGTKILTNPLISTGIYNLDVTALTAGQTYYFKAFATNNTGTGYGSELSFTTKTTPTVTTTAISNITTISATGGGNVTNDGGDAVTARGICWATTATPTLANSFTMDASGTGIFTSSMANLIANGQTYYVRAYATNAYGTTYGNQVSFVTNCSATNIPYTQNFDGVITPAIPACMTVTDDNGISPNWATSTGGVTANAMKIGYTAAGAGPLNDWFFTPSLNLTAGKTYKVSFKYKGGSSSYVEKLEVKWGAGANAAAMTSSAIFSNISFYVANYQTVNAIFTPISSGLYNVGWHAFSVEDQMNIFVDDISITEAQAGLWTGATNNDWATATNWENGVVPSAATNVTIPATATNFPTVTTSATINNLTIESNASGTGSLLDNGNLTINGTATVKQYVVGDKWHLISSPIQNATANVFHLAAGQADIYIREFNSGAWSYITDLITPIVAKKGYSIWADCITHSTPNPTISFTGVLNTGVQTLPTTGGNNWDLIGNPYTSAIDWDLIDPTNVAQSNISVAGSAVRVWNQTSNVYSAYSKLGGSINNGKRYIAPMQGFFVQSLDANGITLNDSYRVHNGQQFVKSTNSISDLMKITAQRNTYKDEINVVMNPIATNSYDFQYDATKLFVNDVNIPEIYTVSGNKNLVINIFGSAPIAIPMNIRMGVADNVTLTASEFANFDANVNITLEDMLTGITQDLRQNPTYTFAATIGENANRFVLHFATPNGINEPNAGNISIYANNNNIYVNTTELVKEISVYNMLGQVITTISGNAKSLNTINMNNATGNYVVKVTTEKGVRTEKVFVK